MQILETWLSKNGCHEIVNVGDHEIQLPKYF